MPAFSADPMTELEAVNMMLMSIGKSPVNTLSVLGINSVSFAQSTLYEITREVQSRSWWFNTETEYSISPDQNGNILVPESVLDIYAFESFRNYIERWNPAVGGGARALYDLDNHTFNIGQYLNGQPLSTNILWCFPFEQIPQVARTYIARRAGRAFQTQSVGSQVLYSFTKELELDAEAELQRAEAKNAKSNLFRQPTLTGLTVIRQRGYRRPI